MHVPMSEQTEARFLAALETEPKMGSDSFVNLLLDAFDAVDSGSFHAEADVRGRIDAVRQGSHYCELTSV